MPRPPQLDPPAVPRTPAIGYALARALGPPLPTRAAGPAGVVLEVARALDLEGRLAARVSLQQLALELGRDAALQLFARRVQLEAQARQRAVLLQELQGMAAATGVPSAPLKAAALEARGLVPPGARRAGDLDLLVPRDRARFFAARLRERGFCPTGHSARGHQLPPLRTPAGHVLELHVSVPGVSGDGDWTALLAAGLLEPDPGARDGLAHRPTPRLLAAHAVVHGLWQHALSPEAYPPGRLLCDLCDLSVAGLLPAPDELVGWVEPGVPARRLEALLSLVDGLRRGALPAEAEGRDETPGRLLDHVLAAGLDARYRLRLRRRERVSSLVSRDLPRALWHALVPSRALLELRYGRATGPLGRLTRRLRHPLGLLVRAARLLRLRGDAA